MAKTSGLMDRIAARLGIWALRRLYGGDCPTDIRDDFLEDPTVPSCLSCDAKRLIASMQRDILDQPGRE